MIRVVQCNLKDTFRADDRGADVDLGVSQGGEVAGAAAVVWVGIHAVAEGILIGVRVGVGRAAAAGIATAAGAAGWSGGDAAAFTPRGRAAVREKGADAVGVGGAALHGVVGGKRWCPGR